MTSYVKTVWVDDDIPALDAANLNNIEDGIAAATAAIREIEQTLQTLTAAVQTLRASIPTKATAEQVSDETDSGYVTPAQVGQMVDSIFSNGALKYIRGSLNYVDKNNIAHEIV
mgnify:CR=1 FL=1